MFLILRRGADLTIAETKGQYDDARNSEYVPFFQTEDAVYARAFFHAWYGLSGLLADGYIDAKELRPNMHYSDFLRQTQNELSAAAALPEVRRYYPDPRERLLEDLSYMDTAYVLVHPSDLSCKLTGCYDHSCILETQGYLFIRIDTLAYAYGFRDGFLGLLSDLYDLLINKGYHAIESLLKTERFQEASLPVSERYIDQQTLKKLYPAEAVPDIHVISMHVKEGREPLHMLAPTSDRSEEGYADGQRAARVFCRDLHAQSVSPTFLTTLCHAVTAP